MRYARTSLLEEMRLDYIRTARSKGYPRRTVVLRHGLRNALIRSSTVIGLGSGDHHRLDHHGAGATPSRNGSVLSAVSGGPGLPCHAGDFLLYGLRSCS